MKIKNVFDRIFSEENMLAAYEDAARGKRYKRQVLKYTFDVYAENKRSIEEVYNGTYEIERYFIFFIQEPKKRMIMSISFRHRVVQWAIYRIVNPMLVKGYIRDSYGCIPSRGALGAMLRLRGWVQYASRKPGKWYYLKLDISKYFYRISHEVLKKIIRKKIKDERLCKLLDGIIDCKHTPFGLPPGKKPEEVPLEERLYDVGMPIGNLLSQMFANLYLNELDQFCKRVLRIHFYIRYMDDVIILFPGKRQLQEWLERIRTFLKEELRLDLNQKTCIRPIGQGMEFVGYRIRTKRVTLRKSTTLRIKRSEKGVKKKYRLNLMTAEKAAETIETYIGMTKQTDHEALTRQLRRDKAEILGEGEMVELFVCRHSPERCAMGYTKCNDGCWMYGNCKFCKDRSKRPDEFPCRVCKSLTIPEGREGGEER